MLVAIGTVSLAVRRLHDSGKSGFWWLIGFIPIIGTITLIEGYSGHSIEVQSNHR